MFKIGKVLVLSVVIVSLASAAFATTSRVIGLASAAPYINDDSDVFRWYGTVNSYGDMVMAEAGQATVGFALGDLSTAYQALGFLKTLGKDGGMGTVGIHLLYNSIEDGSFFAFNPLGTPGLEGTNATPTTKFVLQYGNDIGEVVAIGITLAISSSSVETTAGGTNDIKYYAFGAGARGDLGEKMYWDAALTFGTAGGDTLGGFDPGSAFDFAGRLFWEWQEDLTLVPYLDFNTWNFAYTNIAATSGLKKSSDVTLGLSFDWDVNTNNMLIFATEVEFATFEPSKVAAGDQSKLSFTNLPKFYVALESDITSWLTTRVGASKEMQKEEITDAAGDKTTTTAPTTPGGDFEWSLGAGLHIGEWDVDLVFSHELPFRLGYWLTGWGVGDIDPPVGRVSGTYRF
jgi:hypothetical protein